MWAFFASLPALLAVLGYVVYLLVGAQKRLDDITKKIIDKSGRSAALDKKGCDLKALFPRQVVRLLATDQTFRQAVAEKDRQLLERVIADIRTQRFVTAGLVLIVFAVAIGAFLYMHHTAEGTRLRISTIRAIDDEERAEGLLVDTDPLRIAWAYGGEPCDVEIGVESPRNPQLVSQFKRVRSSEGTIQLQPSDYRSVLTDRSPNGKNSVRAVVRGPEETFVSGEFEVAVGITIKTFHKDQTVYLTALIDDSTATLPTYLWRGDVVYRLRSSGRPKVIDGDDYHNPHTELILADYDDIDWGTFGVTYHGPDDKRSIRFRSMHFSPAR